jgi:2-dehydro-3-deoxygluconokinase
MYFMERGFGMRTPTGCSDRGNTAVSQLKPGDVDWNGIFGERSTRWFHTGGIFAGLSETTATVAAEAMERARASGAIVSYDLNYRESLWSGRGGREAANETNRKLLPFADVVFGLENFDSHLSGFSEKQFRESAEKMISRHPNIKVLATTLRDVASASRHSIGGACYRDGSVYRSRDYVDAEVLDRVGSGDAFAAGTIVGSLNGWEMQKSIEIATASAVLSMASVGDGLSSTAEEIERLADSGHSHALR